MTLPAASRAFVFAGVSTLIDACLVSLVHRLGAVLEKGWGSVEEHIGVAAELKNILPGKEVGMGDLVGEVQEVLRVLLYAKTPAECWRA